MIKHLPEFLYCGLKNPIFIYELLDPISMECRYIGKTKNLKNRYEAHLRKEKVKTYKGNWIEFLKKRNLKPIMRVVSVCEDFLANNTEILYICNGTNLTNMTAGGDGIINMTPEIKAKIRLTKFKNFKRPIKNLSKKPKNIVGVCVNTYNIITFNSVSEAANFVNGNKYHIGSCCRKYPHFKTHKGYIWRYLEK